MAAKTIEIVYQTDEILVVNKPCGVSTQGGASSGVPLDKMLSKQLGQKVCLVHRLDRDTSGLVIVSKTSAAAAKWTRLVSSREVKKEYTAICLGVPKALQGIITEPIVQKGRHGMEKKDAKTQYEVIKSVRLKEGCALSLVKARLFTGRRHQIRVHLAHILCPVACDPLHGNFALNRMLRDVYKTKTLCLASTSLTLPEGIVVTAPLPPHMAELIRQANMDIITP